MTQMERHGPLVGVPAWFFERNMPDHWFERIVGLCVRRSNWSMGDLPLEKLPIDENELIAVGLAMRDPQLLRYLGHDPRSAWEVVLWPEGIDQIRKEVCWQLSEMKRLDANKVAGFVDLFDAYEPHNALRRARFATAHATALDKEGDQDGARQSTAWATLQRDIAQARQTRDNENFNAGAAYLMNVAPGRALTPHRQSTRSSRSPI